MRGFREMRGLKEHAKERSLARGTSGGRRSGRARTEHTGAETPSRAQWSGLRWVVHAEAQGRRSATAGNKRSAAAMERKGWIVWQHGLPSQEKDLPSQGKNGWVITDKGRVAYERGEKKYGVKP